MIFVFYQFQNLNFDQTLPLSQCQLAPAFKRWMEKPACRGGAVLYLSLSYEIINLGKEYCQNNQNWMKWQ